MEVHKLTYILVLTVFLTLITGFSTAQTSLDPLCDDCSAPQSLDGDKYVEDVNGDGELSFADADILFQNYESLDSDVFDFNRDGNVGIEDVTMLDNMRRSGSSDHEPICDTCRSPRDIDDDGKLEDLNGNGVLDFHDLEVLFDNGDRLQSSDFDFDGNGETNFIDVNALYDELKRRNGEDTDQELNGFEPVCGDCNAPTDPDGDGLYEDVNGDEAVTQADSTVLSNAEFFSTQEDRYLEGFDYNDNGVVGFGDVEYLYNLANKTDSESSTSWDVEKGELQRVQAKTVVSKNPYLKITHVTEGEDDYISYRAMDGETEYGARLEEGEGVALYEGLTLHFCGASNQVAEIVWTGDGSTTERACGLSDFYETSGTGSTEDPTSDGTDDSSLSDDERRNAEEGLGNVETDTRKISLQKGWNMISVRGEGYGSFEDLKSQCDTQGVLWYLSDQEWNEETQIWSHRGYYVKANQDCDASVSFTSAELPDTVLTSGGKGWNMVSAPSDNYAFTDIVSCQLNSETLWHYGGQEWIKTGVGESMDPSKGYFYRKTQDGGCEVAVAGSSNQNLT